MYGILAPEDSEIGVSQLAVCDGSVVAGDGTYLGALPIVEYEPRVLQFGSLRDTLVPVKKDFLTSLTMTAIGAFALTLDNTDGYFSILLGDNRDESFLTSICTIYHGFRGLAFANFIKIIQGEVTEVQLSQDTLVLTSITT